MASGEPLPDIYAQLASAYVSLDRFEEALETARKSMQGKVKLKEYVHIYAHCEMLAGSKDSASRELEELLKTTPDYPPALLLAGTIFCLREEEEKARETFLLLLKEKIRITVPLNKYARQFHTLGKKHEALLILNSMIENGIHDQETERLLAILQHA